MFCSRIRDELRFRHLFFEGCDLFFRDERVIRPVAHQHLRLHRPADWSQTPERTVKAHHRIEVHSLPRHAQYRRSAKAIPDRRDLLRVHRRLGFQRIQRRHESSFRCLRVLRHFADKCSGFLRVRRRLAATKHVHRQRRVAQRRDLLRPRARIVVQAPPLMHHQHARPRPGDRVIPRQIPLHRRAVGRIGQLLRLDGRLQRQGGNEGEQ